MNAVDFATSPQVAHELTTRWPVTRQPGAARQPAPWQAAQRPAARWPGAPRPETWPQVAGRRAEPQRDEPARSRQSPWRRLWPWLVLWPWSAAWAWWHIRGAGQSWHYFAAGGRLLLASGPGTGLQLYAAHPQLQFGPLTLLISGVLESLGNSQVPVIVAMSATGPPLLALVWRLVPAAERVHRSRLLLAGLVFLPVWTEVTTHFAHLDDMLALGLSTVALHAVTRRHPVWAGLALAAATDAKPWAVAFVALLFVLPGRQRWIALGAFAGGVAVAWLPFVIADPHTLMAARYTIPNDPTSALRVLGVSTPRTPWWDRPAQFALGVVGGAVAVWRGRWQAAMLIAISARILLDPGVYPYYTSGVLLATVVVDLVVTRWRLPWVSVVAATLLYASRFSELVPMSLHQLGVLRLVFAIGVPLAVLAVPGWWMIRRPGRHARERERAAQPAPRRAAPARA